MATIAIGQRIGSGGAELGALIARRLEARFLGLDDLRREAASLYQVDPEQLRVFDTREPHFWDSDLGGMMPTQCGGMAHYVQRLGTASSFQHWMSASLCVSGNRH
jgi:hypothetical protein